MGQALASPWHEKGKWEGVGEAQRLAERRRGEKGGSAAGRAFPWGHAAGQVSRSRLSRGREGAVGEWQVYRADNKGSAGLEKGIQFVPLTLRLTSGPHVLSHSGRSISPQMAFA